MKTKILVTGSSGFLGRNIVELLKKDYEVFSTYRNNSVPDGWCCDLTSLSATRYMLNKIKPEVIVHTAAVASPKTNDPVGMLNDNVLTTLNLLESAQEKSKFVFISSVSVYGDTYPIEFPTSLYGATKIASENLITAYMTLKGIKRRVVRTCAIVGQNTTHGLLCDLKRKLLSDSKELELIGAEPGSRKPYVHVDELCKFIKEVMIELDDKFFAPDDYIPNFSEIMDFGPLTNSSVKEIAEAVMEKMGIFKPIKWNESAVWKGDNKEISYATKWNTSLYIPTMSSIEAIKNAV